MKIVSYSGENCIVDINGQEEETSIFLMGFLILYGIKVDNMTIDSDGNFKIDAPEIEQIKENKKKSRVVSNKNNSEELSTRDKVAEQFKKLGYTFDDNASIADIFTSVRQAVEVENAVLDTNTNADKKIWSIVKKVYNNLDEILCIKSIKKHTYVAYRSMEMFEQYPELAFIVDKEILCDMLGWHRYKELVGDSYDREVYIQPIDILKLNLDYIKKRQKRFGLVDDYIVFPICIYTDEDLNNYPTYYLHNSKSGKYYLLATDLFKKYEYLTVSYVDKKAEEARVGRLSWTLKDGSLDRYWYKAFNEVIANALSPNEYNFLYTMITNTHRIVRTNVDNEVVNAFYEVLAESEAFFSGERHFDRCKDRNYLNRLQHYKNQNRILSCNGVWQEFYEEERKNLRDS